MSRCCLQRFKGTLDSGHHSKAVTISDILSILLVSCQIQPLPLIGSSAPLHHFGYTTLHHHTITWDSQQFAKTLSVLHIQFLRWTKVIVEVIVTLHKIIICSFKRQMNKPGWQACQCGKFPRTISISIF